MSRPFFRAAFAVLASLSLTAGGASAQGCATRYELGGQFSLLARREPTSQYSFNTQTEPLTVSEPGVGGRFTYNLTRNVAFEAEINFLPTRGTSPGYPTLVVGAPAGRILQGQFGVKAGRRFRRFGLFGKLRPGFVRFGTVSTFKGSHEVVYFDSRIGEVHYRVPEFRFETETYPSTDAGGVLEFYPSRRVVARFDLGDTVIRYGVFREPSSDVCVLSAPCAPRLFERPPETKHNLQFSAGFAFRF